MQSKYPHREAYNSINSKKTDPSGSAFLCLQNEHQQPVTLQLSALSYLSLPPLNTPSVPGILEELLH